MNKIILSLSMIAFVAAIAIVGTTAYFSDTEKSTGNTFTAGVFDLTIDSDCHFNGMACTDKTWDDTGIACDCKWNAKDLTNEKFFNLANLKPGDQGEATISMHVSGDNFYVRSKVDGVKNDDHHCNSQEKKVETWMYGAGNETCGWTGGGELGANMDFAFWADMGTLWGYDCPAGEPKCVADPEEGDNILNTFFEYGTYLVTAAAPDPGTDWSYVKNTSGEDWEFIDGSTYYMGVAWCVGDLSVADAAGNYAITCNGSSASNIIQSDSYSSDMTFEVIQATHNNSTNPWGN